MFTLGRVHFAVCPPDRGDEPDSRGSGPFLCGFGGFGVGAASDPVDGVLYVSSGHEGVETVDRRPQGTRQ